MTPELTDALLALVYLLIGVLGRHYGMQFWWRAKGKPERRKK